MAKYILRTSVILLCLSGSDILAAPQGSTVVGARAKKPERRRDVVVSRPGSNSLYDHIMGNLQQQNQFVRLSALPNGIPPPLASDEKGDLPPLPIYQYAFVNPALNGEKTPHWTETLEKFNKNPAISPAVKDKVAQSLQNPIKIYGDGTESRFPLIVEYFVQRIQNYFSHYVYEDMSRPSSWDVKPNVSDSKPSSEKEPVVVEEDVKLDLTDSLTNHNSTAVDAASDDIDYIVDLTIRPDIEDEVEDVQMHINEEDFEKTTEEWESHSHHGTGQESAQPTVIVEKETVHLKVLPPIPLEDDSFLYVGDGTGEEFDELQRSNKRKKLRKKNRVSPKSMQWIL